MQQTLELVPDEYFSLLKNAFQELVQVASENVQNHTIDKTIYQPATLHSILEKVDEIDESQIKDKKPSDNIEQKKAELLEIGQHPELITTNFYTQAVLRAMQTKKVKNESINCAYIHSIQGFPSLKAEQQKLKNCKLQSYILAQEQENRFLKSIQPNVYQINNIKQIEKQVKNRFIIHFTVYHPFTHKKTQEIIATNNATLQSVIDEIDCPVEQTEKMFYKDELELFEVPSLSIGDRDDVIGTLKIELCKQYTYKHLNQCKHRIYVNELRYNPSSTKLKQEKDNNLQDIPMVSTIYKAPLKIRSCEGCGRSAQLFRVQDPLIPGSSPVFLCNFCNEQLHGDDQNKILKYFCD